MRETVIRENEAGQRFDKYLKKYLPEAPGSFLYKMLRKKNILLNERKASGSEKLCQGDRVKFYLSEDTLGKFAGRHAPDEKAVAACADIPVIYEDRDILIVNKPAGLLSQKAKKDDVSAVEAVTGYLLKNGSLTQESLLTFRPGVCNRLDRNTSGMIVAGKSLLGLQVMSELFKSRRLKKYYLCIVKGAVTEKRHVCGYLRKDGETNRVKIWPEVPEGRGHSGLSEDDLVPIETEYEPVAYCPQLTLLKVHLITGRTHQIRAQLAAEGRPILGDYKYGLRSFNDRYQKRYGISSQLLHAYCLQFPEMAGDMARLSGAEFYAAVPPVFYKLIEDVKWQHGIQEALEVPH